MRCTPIFEIFFLEISVPFDFYPRISGFFGRMVCFSEIQQFPDVLELFPGNFRTICTRFENFEIFGRMISARGQLISVKYLRRKARSIGN